MLHPSTHASVATNNGAPANSPIPSYLQADNLGPWGNYLQQVDRVVPYLGHLGRWADTLKRPKRILIVDVPIHMDDGSIRHFEGYRVQHNKSGRLARVVSAFKRQLNHIFIVDELGCRFSPSLR
jgi:glutamate dehydrogenase (NAD(P)+)